MKYISFLFFMAAIVNGQSQQIVHFTKDTPATIILPSEVSLVYSTQFGSLYKFDSISCGATKIYLGVSLKSFKREFAPKEDKLEDRLDRSEYKSKTLLAGISEALSSPYQSSAFFDGWDYIIIPAYNSKACKSRDFFTETEDFRYSISIEYYLDANIDKIITLSHKLLHSFMTTGFNETSKITLPVIDNDLDIPVILNGWHVAFLPADTLSNELMLSCYTYSVLCNDGLISQNDYLGSTSFQDYTGNSVEANLYNLHKIQIGNKILYDVDCLVAKQGQFNCITSIGKELLTEMGPYKIDKEKRTLEFK